MLTVASERDAVKVQTGGATFVKVMQRRRGRRAPSLSPSRGACREARAIYDNATSPAFASS